jgi:hypothetical protein
VDVARLGALELPTMKPSANGPVPLWPYQVFNVLKRWCSECGLHTPQEQLGIWWMCHRCGRCGR